MTRTAAVRTAVDGRNRGQVHHRLDPADTQDSVGDLLVIGEVDRSGRAVGLDFEKCRAQTSKVSLGSEHHLPTSKHWSVSAAGPRLPVH